MSSFQSNVLIMQINSALWVITKSKSGYNLRDTSRLSSGDWLSFAAGEPYATIVAATQSDSARWQHDLDEKIVSDDD